ncbi:hypothetical protein, conserved [Trypanosoma brucei gambiense DAL972]|uniref:Uncharacterized protein n=1 Tax=Trypanosoma brucei gambiense (strain MHOM/CI/86/DAL972) TaxID=679716 RepID=C9ZY09_TRYB9|nr:hypothetical protein, conserved [Trypanosoma brucei gambiense DAL972]CBH14304.1 hypothetical protein, conserved [Trypanosoma brucei gambiense DAL972]|eukprot:XP_011776574.1 hypothetical protein, conserved [Trypanosoma brucei gambiense DAL972]
MASNGLAESSEGSLPDDLWLIIGLGGSGALLILLIPVVFLARHFYDRRHFISAAPLPSQNHLPSSKIRLRSNSAPPASLAALCGQSGSYAGFGIGATSAGGGVYNEAVPHNGPTNTNCFNSGTLGAAYNPSTPSGWEAEAGRSFTTLSIGLSAPQPTWSDTTGERQHPPATPVGDTSQLGYNPLAVTKEAHLFQFHPNVPQECGGPPQESADPAQPSPQCTTEDAEPQPCLRRRNSRVSFVGEFRA